MDFQSIALPTELPARRIFERANSRRTPNRCKPPRNTHPPQLFPPPCPSVVSITPHFSVSSSVLSVPSVVNSSLAFLRVSCLRAKPLLPSEHHCGGSILTVSSRS